jgi:hypothetical protein
MEHENMSMCDALASIVIARPIISPNCGCEWQSFLLIRLFDCSRNFHHTFVVLRQLEAFEKKIIKMRN